MVHVSQDFLEHLNDFNSTKFKLDLQRKSFIYEIINLGEMLIGPIYDNWDVKFASAIINAGVMYNPNNLLFGLYSRNNTVMQAHVRDIKNSMSINDYHISSDILDAMYSSNYVRNYKSFKCFYSPAILANITKTSRKEYREKIYQLYKELYDGGELFIKDVLDISSIAVMRYFNITFITPITDSSAWKYALYLNSSANNKIKVASLFPFSNFSDLEVGIMLHELTHLSMNYIFQNNNSPYRALNNSQQQEYNFAAKQMISNITSFMQLNFSTADIENTNVTAVNIKNDLLFKKDIILYSAIHRLDEKMILDLVSKIFFNFNVRSSDSTEKYIKTLYEAEVIAKKISKAEEIALGSFGEWTIYPDRELDKESIARFVELHYRFKKLNYSQDSLQSMITYWLNNISPKVAELKTSLNLSDCAGNETFIFDYDEGDQSIASYQDNLSGVAGTIALVSITYFIGYLAANFPFPHHPMVECEW